MSARGARIIAADSPQLAEAEWALSLLCALDGEDLFWNMSIYRIADGAIAAADAFSCYAGLSSRNLMRDSAQRVASRFQPDNYQVDSANIRTVQLTLLSSQIGIEVLVGTTKEASWSLGIFQEKTLVSSWIPVFNAPLVLTLRKEGFWPAQLRLAPQRLDAPIRIPTLKPMTRHQLSLGTSPARLMGALLEYRYTPIGEALYVRAMVSPWLQQSGTASVFHVETTLGLGMYLPLPRYSPLQISLRVGAGLWTTFPPANSSLPISFDLVLEPGALCLEWDLGHVAFFLDGRVLYSLGMMGGFLGQRWLESPLLGPLSLSAGVIYKW